VSEKPIFLEAKIELLEETADLREAASTIVLPSGTDKQIDLQYFKAIFVSSGENLNHAFFMPSELVAAEGTIVNKALDIEHKEEEIIGHIYERAFIDTDGNSLDIKELASIETSSLDGKDMHIVIAGIIYKNRFPDIAKEVAEGKWCVSMETYYQDYDIKIGNLVITQNEAKALGLASDDSMFGKVAKVIKKGKEIAEGAVARVLRRLTFSGCGIVINPANPPSKILEVAKQKEADIILNYDLLEEEEDVVDINNVTSSLIENVNADTSDVIEEKNKEESELQYNDTVGVCVSYKRRVIDATFEGPNADVIHENWCTSYDTACTALSADATDPKCLRNVRQAAAMYAEKLFADKHEGERTEKLVETLNAVINKTAKFRVKER